MTSGSGDEKRAVNGVEVAHFPLRGDDLDRAPSFESEFERATARVDKPTRYELPILVIDLNSLRDGMRNHMLPVQCGQDAVGKAHRPFEIRGQPTESTRSGEGRPQKPEPADYGKPAARSRQPPPPTGVLADPVSGQRPVSDKHPAEDKDNPYENRIQNSPCMRWTTKRDASGRLLPSTRFIASAP